jgi:hypothetical protein
MQPAIVTLKPCIKVAALLYKDLSSTFVVKSSTKQKDGTLKRNNPETNAHASAVMREMCDIFIDGSHKRAKLHALHTKYNIEGELPDRFQASDVLRAIKEHFQ